MKSLCFSFWKNESGATAIEYALFVSGISIAIILGLGSLSSALKVVFNTLTAALSKHSV